jgi:hypothetical protein
MLQITSGTTSNDYDYVIFILLKAAVVFPAIS